MFYYKQEYEDVVFSLQTCSKHIDNLPEGFTEITAEEYADIAEEMRKAAEAAALEDSEAAAAEEESAGSNSVLLNPAESAE